jgi:hypothetical protein
MPKPAAMAAKSRPGVEAARDVAAVVEEFLLLADQASLPLSMTITVTLARISARVASSWMFMRSDPSPVTQTTRASGFAREAPIAVGRPKPIVPKPPEVRKLRGRLIFMAWAAPSGAGPRRW